MAADTHTLRLINGPLTALIVSAAAVYFTCKNLVYQLNSVQIFSNLEEKHVLLTSGGTLMDQQSCMLPHVPVQNDSVDLIWRDNNKSDFHDTRLEQKVSKQMVVSLLKTFTWNMQPLLKLCIMTRITSRSFPTPNPLHNPCKIYPVKSHLNANKSV
ncbi:hypothetical protein ATANTOWER_022738 [Ataeniobius toweri]|uniref:Uncharacterized protein n=1 Tax=Ataeniobius toweri TaxID=208326 RepID=A0ABU7CG59_9TELE|nr:hypothetical protein [Ataeniobius toweri]